MTDIHFHTIIENSNNKVFVFNGNELGRSIGAKIDRQRYIVSQALETIFNNEKVVVQHDVNGAPLLTSHPKWQISISHSGDWYSIQLSTDELIGVDIQCRKKDIKRGKTYFVNKAELNEFPLDDLQLHLIWCAKEAVYKMKKGQIGRYKEDITVVNISSDSMLVRVSDNDYKCSWRELENTILVYLNH